jgi:hypothetical protein
LIADSDAHQVGAARTETKAVAEAKKPLTVELVGEEHLVVGVAHFNPAGPGGA